jgi:hypothetical protein
MSRFSTAFACVVHFSETIVEPESRMPFAERTNGYRIVTKPTKLHDISVLLSFELAFVRVNVRLGSFTAMIYHSVTDSTLA